MRLVQFVSKNGDRQVAKVGENEKQVQVLAGTERIYDLALEAARRGTTLQNLVSSRLSGERADYDAIVAEQRLLPPLDHPDPAHCLVTGTGLTHLGSAQARDAMHARMAADAPLTDSMRLYQQGLDGGKPPAGQISVQPEWFFKGNGYNVTPPEQPLVSPAFALDGSEEAELVGLYVVGDAGEVFRVGFALGNEFSDHVMESQNYLYLAHSKLRSCSFGPELQVEAPPRHVSGLVSIHRGGSILWEAPFLTGEDHMSYAIASLEHHLFKYELFRQPGDVHCHFFGTAVLSYKAGIVTQPGDRIEISAQDFGRPLRNAVERAQEDQKMVIVHSL